MDTELLKAMAQQCVDYAKAHNKDTRFSLDQHQDCKEAMDGLNKSWEDYPELVTIMASDIPKADKARALQGYLRQASGNAEKLYAKAKLLMDRSKLAFQAAAEDPMKAFGKPILPDVEHTYQGLVALAEKWGSCVTFNGNHLSIIWPEIKVIRFDKIRKTYKNISVQIMTDGMNVIISIPKAHQTAIGHGGQVHPHILTSNRLCLQGDSALLVGLATKEARIFDLVEIIYQLMIEPYESIPHTQDIAGVADAELLCDKCKTWQLWKDKHNAQLKLNTTVIHGATMVKSCNFTCEKCLPKCPDTGLLVMPGSGFTYQGKEYHNNCAVNDNGKIYPKSACFIDVDGQWVAKESADKCFLTGQMGRAMAAPKECDGINGLVGFPNRLIKLKGGKCVVAACLDLVDEQGNIEGVSRDKQPWWIGRLDNSAWAKPGTGWYERVKARVSAAKEHAKAGQGGATGLFPDSVVQAADLD